MTKLKPCPFCGDKNIHLYFTEGCKWVVGCKSLGCVCLYTEGKLYNDKEKAIEAWNRRQPDLIAQMQNGIKATDADDAYSCGMRNGMRWCISLIDDKEPLYEQCTRISGITGSVQEQKGKENRPCQL